MDLEQGSLGIRLGTMIRHYDDRVVGIVRLSEVGNPALIEDVLKDLMSRGFGLLT